MRTLRRLRIATILALGLFALAACDQGPEVRTITPNSATSQCIGDPRTPECAVETLLACVARIDWSLCQIAVHGAGGSICKSHPDMEPCTTYLEEQAEFERYLVAVGRASEIESYDKLQGYAERMGVEWPAPVWSKFSYRIRRIGHVEDKAELRKLVELKMVPEISLLEVDVDRWVCTRRVPEDPLAKDLENFRELQADGLPVDEPGHGIRATLRSLLRRLQTIAWEYGLAREPFYWIWYDVGSDYCWEPLKYWVGMVDGQWFAVRWTPEGQGFCDLACGCPDYRWPPFRKVTKGGCAPVGHAVE